MKKLQLWHVILLILFFPIVIPAAVVWLFRFLSSKFPKIAVTLDALWTVLAVSALISIYETPDDLAGIAFCAVLFVLVPAAVVAWGVIRHNSLHSDVTESKPPEPKIKPETAPSLPVYEQSTIYRELESAQKKREELWNSPVVRRHYDLLDEEGRLYSKIHKSGDYHSADAYRFESICKEDISIAEEFVRLYKNNREIVPRYPCFKQLAIFYEKQGNYHLAVTVCEEAIRLGFEEDGTQGGMTGRMEKLDRKISNH